MQPYLLFRVMLGTACFVFFAMIQVTDAIPVNAEDLVFEQAEPASADKLRGLASHAIQAAMQGADKDSIQKVTGVTANVQRRKQKSVKVVDPKMVFGLASAKTEEVTEKIAPASAHWWKKPPSPTPFVGSRSMVPSPPAPAPHVVQGPPTYHVHPPRQVAKRASQEEETEVNARMKDAEEASAFSASEDAVATSPTPQPTFYLPSEPISGGFATANADTESVINDEAHSVQPQGAILAAAEQAGEAKEESEVKKKNAAAAGSKKSPAKKTTKKVVAKKGAASRTGATTIFSVGLALAAVGAVQFSAL